MLCLALQCPLALCSSLAQPQGASRRWALLLPSPACPVPSPGKEITLWHQRVGHREEGTSVSAGACDGRGWLFTP